MTDIHDLEHRLGYTFHQPDLLTTALTHPSFRYEQPEVEADNQRLEFLGDAALGLVAATHFYQTHPDMQEGDLTRARSLLASTPALAAAARRIDLGPALRLGRGEAMNGGHDRESNLADALEAILGAALLDGGTDAVASIFHTVLAHTTTESERWRGSDNPKGYLQEWRQQRGLPLPEYKVTEEDGPPHDKHYVISVFIDEQCIGVGQGPSKREAERQAAIDALSHKRHLNGIC